MRLLQSTPLSHQDFQTLLDAAQAELRKYPEVRSVLRKVVEHLSAQTAEGYDKAATLEEMTRIQGARQAYGKLHAVLTRNT